MHHLLNSHHRRVYRRSAGRPLIPRTTLVRVASVHLCARAQSQLLKNRQMAACGWGFPQNHSLVQCTGTLPPFNIGRVDGIAREQKKNNHQIKVYRPSLNRKLVCWSMGTTIKPVRFFGATCGNRTTAHSHLPGFRANFPTDWLKH